MNVGKNFRDVKAVYYDGVNKGIADIALEDDGVTGALIAVIHDTDKDTLLFHAGVESLKNASNTTYTYRTIDQTVTIANTGLLSKSISSIPDEFYPYVGTLTDDQERDLYLVPLVDVFAGAPRAATQPPPRREA